MKMNRDRSDLDFFRGSKLIKYYVERDVHTAKEDLHVELNKKGETRIFTPHQFFEVLEEVYFIDNDRIEDAEIKLTKIYDLKRDVLHYVYLFREEMGRELSAEYDFDDHVNIVDSTIDKIRLQLEFQKAQLDRQKYDLEIKKYEIEVDKLGYDRDNAKRTFNTWWWTFGFSALALIISLTLLVLKLTEKTSIK